MYGLKQISETCKMGVNVVLGLYCRSGGPRSVACCPVLPQGFRVEAGVAAPSPGAHAGPVAPLTPCTLGGACAPKLGSRGAQRGPVAQRGK